MDVDVCRRAHLDASSIGPSAAVGDTAIARLPERAIVSKGTTGHHVVGEKNSGVRVRAALHVVEAEKIGRAIKVATDNTIGAVGLASLTGPATALLQAVGAARCLPTLLCCHW